MEKNHGFALELSKDQRLTQLASGGKGYPDCSNPKFDSDTNVKRAITILKT